MRDLLTEYLRNRNVSCPVCGYNVCNVVTGICPECGMELMLHVHPRHVGPRTSAVGMVGILIGLVANVLITLLGLSSKGFYALVPGIALFVLGIFQLAVWEKYYRRIRARRRDLLWIYVCSGWAILAITVGSAFLR